MNAPDDPQSITPPPPFQPSAPPPQPPGPQNLPPPWWLYPPRPSFGRRLLRWFGVLFFCVSVLINIALIAVLAVTAEMPKMEQSVIRPGDESQVVALYNVSGIIDDRAAERFRDFHDRVVKDRKVKAVVLRVDSPGGGVEASDRIHSMVRKLQTDGGKKVVVSMGSLAASGGYYISCPADEIVAEDTTLTGSIGVLMGWMVLKGTLEKLGMDMVMLKSTDASGWKDAVSAFQKPDPRQRAYLQALLDAMQKRFEQVVRQGRGDRLKTRQATYEIEAPRNEATSGPAVMVKHTETEPLNGKIYLAAEAKELGLVDAIGYEDSAIDRAASLAGLSRPKVVRYEQRRSLAEVLFDAKSHGAVQIGADLIDQLQTPRLMFMWKAD